MEAAKAEQDKTPLPSGSAATKSVGSDSSGSKVKKDLYNKKKDRDTTGASGGKSGKVETESSDDDAMVHAKEQSKLAAAQVGP